MQEAKSFKKNLKEDFSVWEISEIIQTTLIWEEENDGSFNVVRRFLNGGGLPQKMLLELSLLMAQRGAQKISHILTKAARDF